MHRNSGSRAPSMDAFSFLPLLVGFTIFAFALSTALALPSAAPPRGNRVLLKLHGRGYQQYQCNSSKSWEFVQAIAGLYPEWEHDFIPSKRTGLHYFLPYPDGNGGKPTWSLTGVGASNSTPPASTVTGKVLESLPRQGTIDHLLLQATSHSGSGLLSKVSYIERIPLSGGVPPPLSECRKEEMISNVPYESMYVFWSQSREMSVFNSTKDAKTAFMYFGQGHQHYAYNGSNWNLQNATAVLSTLPGELGTGMHYFLPKADLNGGQPTWVTFSPKSSVTGKVMQKAVVDPTSVAWLDLRTTSSYGQQNSIASVTGIQRLSTRGGLPPTSPGYTGQKYSSAYSAIYLFYQSK